MKFRLLLVVLLIGFILPVMNHVVESAQSPYSINWGGKSWDEGSAIKRNGQWYIPAKAINQAYGVSIEVIDNKLLELADRTSNSELDYNPTYYKDKVVTLMYHNVEKNPQDPSFISPNQLEEQLTAIKQAGFNFISMDHYVKFITEQRAIPVNAVLVTFDDGYETFYTEAYPVMKRLGVPATNFIIAEMIGKKYGHPKLTWDQMREMKADGYSFFSHTYNSHRYQAIDAKGKTKPMLISRAYNKKTGKVESQQEYLTRVRQDLSNAEKLLRKELGNDYGVIAFPYGAYNKDVLKIAKELNVKLSFTVMPGINNRRTLNGYRVNGGNQNIDTGLLVQQMRKEGVKTRSAIPYKVRWNGVGISFKSDPLVINGYWYLPLQDMKDQFGLEYTVSDRNKTIALSRHQDLKNRRMYQEY